MLRVVPEEGDEGPDEGEEGPLEAPFPGPWGPLPATGWFSSGPL